MRRRSDGTYAVTLGPHPRLLWLRTDKPVRLGQHLELQTTEATSVALERGKVLVIDGGALRVIKDPFARRVVPRPWLDAVQTVSKWTLFEHQIEGAGWFASRLASRRGAILADDPGLGKTVQTYAALAAARRFPAVIVCPASLKGQWARESACLKDQLKIHILRGETGPIPPAHVLIANYDILGPREKQLSQLGMRAIGFDEVHLLKEPHVDDTHRAAVATRLAHAIGCGFGLTGTPIQNRTQELWRPLHIVAPAEWPDYGAYRDRYCRIDKKDEDEIKASGDYIITSRGAAARIDELHSKIGPVILRRTKSDVLTTLPPKKRRNLRVDLSDTFMGHYKAAERDVIAWLRAVGRGDAADRAKSGGSKALVRLTMLRHIAALGKMRQVLPGYLDRWFTYQHRPLVIFAYHQDVIAGARAVCRSMGLRQVGIDGDSTDRQRDRAVKHFNQVRADAFIAPILAAGVGLNLQHRCRDVLFLERTWVPAQMVQAEDRTHRLGQHGEVGITYLDAARTIDEHLAEVLADKQRLIDTLIDDSPNEHAAMVQETIDGVLARLAA